MSEQWNAEEIWARIKSRLIKAEIARMKGDTTIAYCTHAFGSECECVKIAREARAALLSAKGDER